MGPDVAIHGKGACKLMSYLMNVLYQESTKRAEFIEKNLTIDNRQLRGRLHNIERENALYKEKTAHLEDVIKVS